MTIGYSRSRTRPWGSGADQEDEYDEEVISGQCDKPPVKVATDSRMPTQREIADHCETHLLHRSWCAYERMPTPAKRRSKPTIATDCKEFGEAEDSEDKIKTNILKDEESGCMAAHVVEQKGSADQWAVQRILDDIRMFGHEGRRRASVGAGAARDRRQEVRRISAAEPARRPTVRLSEASRSS